MTRHAKTLGIALAGTAALASTAYALGSESGGGTATAKGARSTTAAVALRRGLAGPGRDDAGLDALAKRLGVTTARLRAAFEDLRPEKPAGDPGNRFAGELAEALGLPAAKVSAALDALRADEERRDGDRRARFASGLAKELGLEADKVQAAFEKLRPARREPGGPRPGGRDAFETALAKELGVKADDLRTALDKLRPDRGAGGPPGRPGGPGGPGGPPPGGPPPGGPPLGARGRGPGPGPSSAALAKALGIETADVQAALDKLRASKRDELAAALAKRLDLPVERVKAALREVVCSPAALTGQAAVFSSASPASSQVLRTSAGVR